ncbi:ABC transporter substrate-binding protein [Bauldia litoralis]|uniref:Peptide/nickel transport system substrate-binding protein n=1 Tax=Bauldia litoralis TaxID=665467 RepID=A0A1G6EAC8_9HYPH|nr:ABC transporter substrate-binding protein [Bauldia litoralis]SDB54394.1 peptide/nickel transport system substrate-binding protein [Bauldia litoralis]
MKPDTKRLLWMLPGLFAAGLAGPAVAADGPFVINTLQAPATMDPAFLCDITDNGYVAPLYAPLVAYGRTTIEGTPEGVTVTKENPNEIVPALAESWSVSDDALVYTFTIRDGLKFASGNAIDGAAVAASLERALKSGSCGTHFMEAADYGNTKSITAEGNTVTVTLDHPQPLLIHALTQPNVSIVDVATVEANGGNDWLATHSAGSGPYLLDSYQPGVKAVFKANPNYYGEPALEPEVVLNFIADPSTLLLQARNDAAQVTLGLPKQMLAEVADSMNIVAVPAPRWELVGLPNRVPPFDNATFRSALSYAVPYDVLVKSVAFGYGESFFGPFPPQLPSYNAELGGPRAFDLDKAKALMAESGVEGPVDLTITIREGRDDHEQIATILQQVWGQLGVDVKISKVSGSAYAEQVSAPEKTTAIMRSDGPSVTFSPWLLNYDMRCASNFNMSNYCNTEAEALFDESNKVADLAARQPYFDKITEIWVADAPRIPLYADVYTAVLDKSVKFWDFAQDGPFEIWRWGR